jgi:hypothetical protein
VRALSAEKPSVTTVGEQLDFIARPSDWYAKALRAPLLACVGVSLDALWRAAAEHADVERLMTLLRRVGELTARDAPEENAVATAAALYLEASALLAPGNGNGPQEPRKRLSDAAALAGRIAACDRAEEVSALLRKGMGDPRRATAEAIMGACLCSLKRYPEGVRVEWGDALAKVVLDGAPRGGKSFDRATPWSAQGERLLRSLMVCLSVSDLLGSEVNPYPLQRYLRESFPRLTRAARRRRKLRRRFRSYFGSDGAPAREAARQTLGSGSTAWLLD